MDILEKIYYHIYSMTSINYTLATDKEDENNFVGIKLFIFYN